MKAPQRVVWSEGLLVSPQHFQQQDLYHERLLDERIAALAPYRWGVVVAELDGGALGAGQVRFTKFAGIMPDGLYAAFEAGDPECPPGRPIDAHFGPTQTSCDVYLAVPKEREGVPSVYVEDGAGGPSTTKAARARFRAGARKVNDLTGNAAEVAMSFALRNAVVLFGDEPRDDFETIKVAEIVRDSRSALIVNEAYIAPSLRIDSSPFLMAGVRRLLALMVSKQRRLSGDRRQRDGAAIAFDAGDITRFLQLTAINGAIPVLTHAAKNGETSPLHLYLLLAQIAGQLASFSNDVDPAKLPVFSHTELRNTFEELIAVVTGLLHEIRESYIAVGLDVAHGVYVGKLEDDRLLRASQYVLAVSSKDKDVGEEQLAQRLPGTCKIASRNLIPQIMRAASPGVPVQLSRRPPSEVPVRAGVVYFTLDLRNENWRPIVADRTIAIFLPPPLDPERVQVELMAVPSSR